MRKKTVYLDHASTSPLLPEAFRVMLPYLKEKFGNPSSLHRAGRVAKEAVKEAAERISKSIHCLPEEIFFTSSATEADNLAIVGVAKTRLGSRIIISSVEHKGVLAAAEVLEKEGFEVVRLPVGKDGVVNLEDLKKALNENTAIVSVTMADSETGTIQPVAEIFEMIKNFRNSASASSPFPLFHTDASQAAACLDIDVRKIGADLLTLSSHKIGGPKGAACLYVRRGVKVSPIIYGGGQGGGLRSGTENVPAIVGFGKAVEICGRNKKAESLKIKKMRYKLERGIFRSIQKVVLNGHPTRRLPNFLNVSFLDVEGEAFLLFLDDLGIMVSTGSACDSEKLEPSHILTALGNPYEFSHGSIRFTLGRENTEQEIDYVLKHLPEVVARLRRISPLDISLEQSEKMSSPRAFVGNQTPHFLREKKNEKAN